MKNLMKFFALAVVILGFSATSFGQANATATSSGTILAALQINKTSNMQFGNIVPGTGGTVVLAVDGSAVGEGVTLIGGQTPSAAVFRVTDGTTTGSATYSITVTPSLTLTSGSNTMLLTDVVRTPTDGGQLDLGIQDIKIGATLNVGSGQAAGIYTNESAFQVTVTYE